jgi:hypothetical protein
MSLTDCSKMAYLRFDELAGAGIAFASESRVTTN